MNENQAIVEAEAGAPDEVREYPGYNRLTYFGLSLLMGFAVLMLGGSLSVAAESSMGLVLTNVAALVVAIWLAIKRLDNLESPRWLAALIIIPVVNMIISIYLTAYPPGYATHRTMDTAAKLLVGFFVLMIVLTIMLLVAAT